MGYVAARTNRHKYIQYRELRGMDELYDLEVDPYEETNLTSRPDAQDTLTRMQGELRRLLEQTTYSAAAKTAAR
jgi:arylsulfatase A-like enzyme